MSRPIRDQSSARGRMSRFGNSVIMQWEHDHGMARSDQRTRYHNCYQRNINKNFRSPSRIRRSRIVAGELSENELRTLNL